MAHRKAHIKSIMAYSIFFPVVETLSALSIALLVLFFCLVYFLWRSRLQRSDYRNVVICLICAHVVSIGIRMLADRFNTLQMGMVSSARVLN